MIVLGESIRVALVILIGLALAAIVLRHRSAALRNQACRFILLASWITPVVATGFALRPQITVATVSPDLVRAAPSWVPRSALPKEAYVVRRPAESQFEASVREESLANRNVFVIILVGFALSMAFAIYGLIRLFRVIWAADRLESYNGIAVCRAKDAALTVPVTIGRTIILPSGSIEWPETRIQACLLHEAAHVRRHDATWQLIARCYCAFNWYNPAAHLLAHVMRSTAEQAADDAVLAAGMRPSDYARELLAVAQDLGTFRSPSVAMVGGNGLKARLHAIVAPARDRRRATLITASIAAALVGGLTLATGGITTRMAKLSLPQIPGAIVVPATKTAILPDGTRVSLELVQSVDLHHVVTWSPDGSPAQPPTLTHSLVGFTPSRQRLVVLEFKAVTSRSEPSFSYGLPDLLKSHFASGGNIDSKTRELRSHISIPEASQFFSTDLRVGIASGPWIDYPSSIHPDLIPDKNTTRVEFLLPRIAEDADWRATAFDANGKALLDYQGVRYNGLDPKGLKRGGFDVRTKPGRQVSHVTLKYRPYRWVTFKDIRLQPDADAIAAGRRPKVQRGPWPGDKTYTVIGVEDAP